MKIKILKGVVAEKLPRKAGDIIDIGKEEAQLLISYGDAEEHKEAPKGRPKKNQQISAS